MCREGLVGASLLLEVQFTQTLLLGIAWLERADMRDKVW